MTHTDPRRILSAVRRRIRDDRELRIYSASERRVRRLPRHRHCRRDAWDDLSCLDAWSYGNLTRTQYLDVVDARRREGSHHLYSLVEHGVLIHYGWVSYPQLRAPDAALGLEFIPPAGSAVLWDYFTHPSARGRGLYLNTLWQCLHDTFEIDRAQQAYIYVYADNAVSRHVIEKAGFEYRGSLVLERRLFRTRRYATCVGDPLDVRLLDSGAPAETRQHAGAMPRLENHEEAEGVVDESNGAGGNDQLRPRASRQHAI